MAGYKGSDTRSLPRDARCQDEGEDESEGEPLGILQEIFGELKVHEEGQFDQRSGGGDVEKDGVGRRKV